MDMKYGVIIAAFVVVVVIILLLVVRLEPVETDLDGDSASYVDPSTCPQKAWWVIQQKELSKIHSCEAEELKLGYETAHLVRILYGRAMDCPSGCIYSRYFAIVFPDNTIRPITDFNFAYPDISKHIWDTIQLPIHDVDSISSKELTYYKDGLAIKYTFHKYIRGELYVSENQPIQGHITPTGTTIDQAENIAVQELRKRGQLLHGKYDMMPHRTLDRDCWNFLIVTEGPSASKCNVIVCLDGDIEVSC